MADSPASWSEWYDRHAASLVLFARQWAFDRADAEDIVQEAFVRFWRSRHNAVDPTAYLYTCVKRYALEWLRGRQRRARRERLVAREEGLFNTPAEDKERQALIETALRKLPDEQREVIVLKIWGGLTFPQIAAALEISANTAASR